MYSAPRNKLRGFRQTLHSGIGWPRDPFKNVSLFYQTLNFKYLTISSNNTSLVSSSNIKHFFPRFLVIVPGEVAAAPFAAPLASTGSPPPSHGLMWFKETCSIKDVPYLWLKKKKHLFQNLSIQCIRKGVVHKWRHGLKMEINNCYNFRDVTFG